MPVYDAKSFMLIYHVDAHDCVCPFGMHSQYHNFTIIYNVHIIIYHLERCVNQNTEIYALMQSVFLSDSRSEFRCDLIDRVILKEYQICSPLAEILKPAIKNLILYEKKKHFKFGFLFNDECFMFISNICTPIRSVRVTSRWEKIQTEIGIKPVTLHGLKHTFWILLAKQGVPIQVVSKLLGHSNIANTVKICTHIDDEQKHEAISKVDSILNG